jgi:hypothetical protein
MPAEAAPLSERRCLTDGRDNRTAVVLAVDGYNHLLEDLEELEAIRAYDEANTSGEDRVSFEQAVEEIEQEHEE